MRHSTKARINASSAAASSLTPRNSTDWLTIGMPASIDAGAGGAGLAGQFPGMIGVQRNPGGRALDLQCRDHLGADALGLGDRHAGVNAG